ncbi:MAG: hypothetical protein ACREJG_01740, partial [Candidatus Rokuibacteriota bacterium]
MRTIGLLALALVLGSGWVTPADGRLADAPLALHVTPPTVAEGGDLTMHLVPASTEPVGPFDVYLSVARDGSDWIFLGPDGTWSGTAAAYRNIETVVPSMPLEVRFNGVNPAGWYRFRAQFIRPHESP